jgi:peptidyl-prolyl cis-trans isomerase A (cyclophilin A)
LKNPALANEKAPEFYKVKFTTTKGDFVISATRASAPVGADRFYNLVKIGFFSDVYFFRMMPGFVAQFGISSDPTISAAWLTARLKDDPVHETNKRGSISFATSGPDSRTTQLFINLADNNRLDGMGFAPFAIISEGMDVVDKLNLEYTDTPDQSAIQMKGGAYLTKTFPRLDKIVSAVVTDPPPAAPAKPAPKPAPPKPAAAKPAAPAGAPKQP